MIHLIKFESFGMNRENCDRCCEPTGGTTTMSVFNQDVICMQCKAEERKDPDYQFALDAETAAIRSGDYNYPGVFPDYKPLKRKH